MILTMEQDLKLMRVTMLNNLRNDLFCHTWKLPQYVVAEMIISSFCKRLEIISILQNALLAFIKIRKFGILTDIVIYAKSQHGS